ncbi:MAG TPA: serine/threonine-protein kinase [Candidatus Angelobacter sp.]|nr:serine/threonine-protein kinase [Candidatus Angelobacter sp.]
MMSIQTVGRYEIVSELGRGAMGVVYKALDPTIGRTVALKTMRLDVHGLDAQEMVRRFQNEARAAGVLNHPNIVTIYDAGEEDGIFYIAMEFIEGTTLHELLAEKRVLPTDEVVQISRQICRGLDYAHSNGIVHRDVKPANIMLTPNGTVKIMDFGIAKSGGQVTNTGQVLGTPNYMAPEQVKGRPLDGRSDLFSLGVILYEMLTGEKPFVGQNVTTIIYKIVNETPITPRDLDVTVHPGLSAIVTKALAKAPDDRYQSGAELIRDLEHYKLAAAGRNGSTGALAAVPGQPDKTVVLPVRVAGNTVKATAAATAPAKGPVPVRRPTTAIISSKRGLLIAAIITILILGSAMGGYAYHRTHVKMRQLAEQTKAKEAEQIAEQHQPIAIAIPPEPTPEATPEHHDVIAPDTTVKFFPARKNAQTGPQKLPTPVKATSSPNQVFVQQSELKLSSQPDGAKVEIDGWSEPNWVTPFTASHLAAGNHTLVFTKTGYLPQTRTVESQTGKSVEVSTALTPTVSTLVVTSNPQGANVWLDGKDSGMVTPTQLTVDKGYHRITVKKAGFRDASSDENLSEGQTASFSPLLLSVNQPSEDGKNPSLFRRLLGTDTVPEGKGLVHIRTNPEGASIVIDGKTAPKKTNARWPADPGVYSIVLQMDGYKSVHRNIKVQKGKVVNIDEILEKQ